MSEQPTDDTKRPTFELLENGEIRHNKKGNSTLLAKYDDKTGILTFETFAIDQKFRTQIQEAVNANPFTGELKGNVIRAYAIAGRPYDKVRPGEPPPPPRSKVLGRKTDAFVKWMFKWRPQMAFAEYKVFLDSTGEPIRAHCHRTEQGLLIPDTSGKPLQIKDDGKSALATTYIEDENAMLAGCATCMTFLRSEVVGASGDEDNNDDDEMPVNAGVLGGEPEDAEVSKGKPGRKPKVAVTEEAD